MIYAVNFETKSFKKFSTYAEMESFILKNQKALAEMAEMQNKPLPKFKDYRKARKEIEAAFKSEVKSHKIVVDNYTYMDSLAQLSNHSNRI